MENGGKEAVEWGEICGRRAAATQRSVGRAPILQSTRTAIHQFTPFPRNFHRPSIEACATTNYFIIVISASSRDDVWSILK